MKISVLEASNYFRGLLLLIRKDRKVSHSETELMKRIGRKLGFEREFCDDAIRDILGNEYVEDSPPEFSTRELALKFIRDGLSLAYSDDECDPSEVQWLLTAAERNGIDAGVFTREQRIISNRQAPALLLEVDDLTVMYHGRPDNEIRV